MKKLNKYYPYILIGLISLSLNLFLNTIGAYSFIESKFFDLKFQLRGPISDIINKEKDVVIVEIDDESYQMIDESYPFPRGSVYAKVIRNLTKAKAKVIVFDIMFDAPDHTTKIIENYLGDHCLNCSYINEDEEFVGAINFAKENGTDIILASKIAVDINRIPQDYLIKPNNKIMSAKPDIGLVNQGIDNIDYNNRRYSIFSKISSEPENFYFSLALETVLKYKNISDYKIIQDPLRNILSIGDINIKTYNKESSFIVNYYGPTSSIFNTFNTFSLSNVIDNSAYNLTNFEYDDDWIDKYINPNHLLYSHFGIDKSPFRDKIVIIGSSLDEDNDFINSPYNEFRGIQKNMPGVELHANAIQQILDSNYIDVSKIYLNITKDNFVYPLLLIILLIIISLIISNQSTLLINTLLVISSMFIWSSFSIGSFLNDQLWSFKKILNIFFDNSFILNQQIINKSILIPVFYPIATILSTYGINLSYNLLKEQRNKKFLKETFGKYVSPKIIDIMYNEKKSPALGGESGIRTAFFSDIQSFSTISEQLTSKKLVKWLNEYLSDQTELILKYQGTLDKYEGDAILAFFGAPLFFKDHAKAALDTSINCQHNLDELKNKWVKEGDQWPKIIHTMKMRVGINSGEMVTGNMGSKYHMNYTMIGDVVNIASRLESAAKQYGIFLHTTEDTLLDAGKKNYYWRYIDRIQFVGKTIPIQTIELLDFKKNKNKNISILIKTFHEGLDLYYQQKWDLAIKKFKESNKLETYNEANNINPSVVFIKRSESFKINPPSKNWNGAHILTKK